MKTILMIISVLLIINSCTPDKFIQVYKVKPITELQNSQNLLVYSDENCTVKYNMWSEGGNPGFAFFNKTDQNITLNLNESFFILNGIAFDYFKNRIYQYSDVNVTEKNEVIIPPNSTKIINEYTICNGYFHYDGLNESSKNGGIVNFNQQNSPYIFSNIISYTSSNENRIINNQFYVYEVSNHAVITSLESDGNDVYGKMKYVTKVDDFNGKSPDSFYVIYGSKVNNHIP